MKLLGKNSHTVNRENWLKIELTNKIFLFLINNIINWSFSAQMKKILFPILYIITHFKCTIKQTTI